MSNKVGRPPIEVSPSDLRTIEALAGHGSTLDEIAHVLGWSPATLDRKLQDEIVRSHYEKGRIVAKNEMAHRLWEIAMSNDEKGIPTKQSVVAAIFWLKAQAKWSDRITVETEAQESIPIQIYLPDNGR